MTLSHLTLTMTQIALILKLDRDMLKIYLHTHNEVLRCSGSKTRQDFPSALTGCKALKAD